MKGLYFVVIILVLASCKETKKVEFTEIDKSLETGLVESADHPGKKIMETLCYTCHDATTTEDNRLGPPMAAIKRRYLIGGQTKNEFINDILAWTAKPSLEKSRMPGAVDRFGVMPYLPVPEENIQLIAEYIYDHDIEQPEWFEEHYQKNNGRH